jgi:signal transduction histidine kinase
LSLKHRFFLYLAVVHLLMGAVAVVFLHQHRGWLFAAEAVFVASLAIGLTLVARVFGALSFAGDSAQFLRDSDYTARFLEVGQPEIDRLIGVYNRMVDHLRAERQRVQEQRYFLSRILEVSPSGVVVLDFDGRLEVVNPAAERILQVAGAALVGRPLGETALPLLGELAALPAGGSRVLSQHGGRRVRVQRGTFVDRGFPRSFFLLEEMTEELRQSEKAAYEKLIRMMSHEVNNSVGASGSLLQSCLSYGTQLADGDRVDFERALQIAIDRMGQLNAFMRSFADVVRLPPPVLQPVDVPGMMDRVRGLLRAECEARGITWRAEHQAVPDPVAMDPVQMEQALVNIAKNAVEAAGPGGVITSRVAREAGRVRIAIEDSGPGIPPEVRSQLFAPFYTTKPNGQGIGLTMVQEILSNHHFEYSLDGPPGGPTTFEIRC